MDLTIEGIEQFMGADIPQAVCFPAVGAAYRLVVDLLQETTSSGSRSTPATVGWSWPGSSYGA